MLIEVFGTFFIDFNEFRLDLEPEDYDWKQSLIMIKLYQNVLNIQTH